MNQFRRFLYILASLLGDINAARKGPQAMAKRYGRKVLTAQASKLINKALK